MLSRPAGVIDHNNDASSLLCTAYSRRPANCGNLGKSSRGLPLSSSFCKIRSQKPRSALTK